MEIIPQEPMTYKQSLQSEETELLTKCRIIRSVLKEKRKYESIVKQFSISRNTIGNIVRDFKLKIASSDQQKILEASLPMEELIEHLSSLKNKKRCPKSNKRSATLSQESLVLNLFQKRRYNYGYKRFWQTIQRKLLHKPPEELKPLRSITFSQIRGIYKRNKLRVKKVRTKNRSHRPLYNYPLLACFEYLHADTKEILDQKALPSEVYERLQLNPELPIFEWNIVDAKTRARFIAYSHTRSSEFGFRYLLFVVMFLRCNNLISPEIRIKMGMDNGAEFYSGSKRKEVEWNAHFNLMNAEVYSYNPHFDVKKNLIEQTHLSDDQEFFVPRAFAMHDEKSFLYEASYYNYHWNALRPHSGIGMNGCTPLDKLKSCGVSAADRILLFPTLILENHIGSIRQVTELVRFQKDFLATDHTSEKDILTLNNDYKNSIYAQNVLTQYHRSSKHH